MEVAVPLRDSVRAVLMNSHVEQVPWGCRSGVIL